VSISQSPPTPAAADANGPQYHDLREVASILKCSVRTVRRLIKAGRLGYSQEKKGGIIRVSDADIAAYYEASRIGPTGAADKRQTAASAA
jgi:excisionase family DNA binding protein